MPDTSHPGELINGHTAIPPPSATLPPDHSASTQDPPEAAPPLPPADEASPEQAPPDKAPIERMRDCLHDLAEVTLDFHAAAARVAKRIDGDARDKLRAAMAAADARAVEIVKRSQEIGKEPTHAA